MDADKLNRWLALGANLAVFASIMFLAVEIRQNQVSIDEANRLSKLDARVIEVEQFNTFREMLLENPALLRTWNNGLADAELSAEDDARFYLLCTNLIWISAGSWERSIALDRMDAATATTSIRAQMINDSSRFARCWREIRRNLIPYGLADYVDDVERDVTVNLQALDKAPPKVTNDNEAGYGDE